MAKLNSYDVLAWWGKAFNSCNTEDQFKNALNLWPKVIKLVPYIHDAWVEVVRAARFKLSRIVPPLNRISRNHVITVNYPETSEELVKHVFNQYLPPVKL